MTKPTVTIELDQFDEIREKAKNYDLLRNGYNGFLNFIASENDKGHELRPLTDFKYWKNRYNATNPKHPF